MRPLVLWVISYRALPVGPIALVWAPSKQDALRKARAILRIHRLVHLHARMSEPAGRTVVAR